MKDTQKMADSVAGPERSEGAGTAEVAEVRTELRRTRTIPEFTALVILLIGMFIFFSVANNNFLTVNNLLNILTAIAVTGIIATPGTILLAAAQVDLSVGS